MKVIRKSIVPLLLFILVFAAELPSISYWAVQYHYVVPDALSRVSNAFTVMYSRDPHLAAIGFVWNPLPSLLELVPLLFWPWWPELAADGVSGMLLTALFAGAGALLLYRTFRASGVSRAFTGLWVLCFAFHPFIYMYGANGMSEGFFTYFLLLSVVGVGAWFHENNMKSILGLGLGLACCFLIRYEAVPLAAAVAAAVLLGSLKRSDPLRKNYLRMEGTAILTLTPFVYAVVLWLWFNFAIQGNAFYFLNSNYSNIGQSVNLSDYFSELQTNEWEILYFITERSLPFLPPLGVILLFRLLTRRLFSREVLALLLMVVSVPVLQFYLLNKGNSYGWLRFFYYPFPIAVAWAGFEWSWLGKKWRPWFGAVLTLSIVVSGVSVYNYMNVPRLSPEEHAMLHFQENDLYKEMSLSRAISADLSSRLAKEPKALVLLDSYGTAEILTTIRYPKQLVITSDRDFLAFIEDPAKADYILVPRNEGKGRQNELNVRFPQLFANGMEGWKLERDYDQQWRLYKKTSAN